IDQVYKGLHAYARSPENFEPEVRQAINDLSKDFSSLTEYITWGDTRFISDMPGKNNETDSLGGGGLSTTVLSEVIHSAKKSIVIQSPYLVLSAEAKELFRDARKRSVSITISTNSSSSTDNLQAFSGYRSQRDEILAMGIDVYEYMPYPAIQKKMLERYAAIKERNPVFALHAKSMVVDGEVVYVGTYNLDPRSQNLNTEVGIIVKNKHLGELVESMIRKDTLEGNSWSAKNNPDQHASLLKRIKVFFWQLFPLEPIL
ncbi:MAG: phospholipase D-like domain-containing protein, partial [Gammaproteobacteria bacterium]|nr:phospholipase D-like domain-containing protein [Gammaproteobacteria bacterium]